MKAAASAPGKVILFGEHFVVSGYPALVTAIEPRAVVRVQRAEKKTVVKSGNVVGVDDAKPHTSTCPRRII
jgi:mevalonate kinase